MRVQFTTVKRVHTAQTEADTAMAVWTVSCSSSVKQWILTLDATSLYIFIPVYQNKFPGSINPLETWALSKIEPCNNFIKFVPEISTAGLTSSIHYLLTPEVSRILPADSKLHVFEGNILIRNGTTLIIKLNSMVILQITLSFLKRHHCLTRRDNPKYPRKKVEV